MSEYIKRYISKEEVPKSDWNQNNVSDPSYIKNRPFYDDTQSGGGLKQLDEKYIPDTIARKSDLDSIDLSAYETKEDSAAKLTEAKEYVNTSIANLVNSAPETMDTLGELATVMQENQDVVDALNDAITNKAQVQFITWEADD